LAADDLTPEQLRRIHPARPFGQPGKLHPHTLAIRSSVTKRRTLYTRFCNPILARALTMPIVRTSRLPAESPELQKHARHELVTTSYFSFSARLGEGRLLPSGKKRRGLRSPAGPKRKCSERNARSNRAWALFSIGTHRGQPQIKVGQSVYRIEFLGRRCG